MKKTKEVILDTALKLFNSQGLAKVKLRTIANQMGISQGNLNYHFKKREEIIEALYYRLFTNISNHMSAPKNKEDSILDILVATNKSVIYELYLYRFIMLDFTQIMRENRSIRTNFQELQMKREQQFRDYFEMLIKSGLMREEYLPNEFRNLYIRFQMFGDFWVSSAEIAENEVTENVIPKYLEIINQAIFPYLTTKGKEQYQLIVTV